MPDEFGWFRRSCSRQLSNCKCVMQRFCELRRLSMSTDVHVHDTGGGLKIRRPSGHGGSTPPQDQNLIAEIDPAKDSVIGSYSVGDCKGNHGMVLDPEHRRAF